MYSPLTPKQLRVLEELRRYQRLRGYMPTVRELARALASSVANMHQHLTALERKGWLLKERGARGITLLGPKSNTHSDGNSRITGVIRKGYLTEPPKAQAIMAKLPIAITKPHLSLVHVADDSLSGHGILANDVLLVDRGRKTPLKHRPMRVSGDRKGLILAIIRPL